jgi:hypothetical protein
MNRALPSSQRDDGMSEFLAPIWETIFKIATWSALIFGGVSITSAFVSAWLGWEITDATQKQANTQIADAQSKGEIARAEAAKANERALQVQLLLNAEIKKNAWRRLTAGQHDDISAAVRSIPPIRLTVAFDGNDPEASVFAAELIKSFEDGGAIANPQPSAVFVGNMPLFGLVLQARPDFDAREIERAISGAAPVEKSESLKNFPAQNRADIFLYVGHKPQAF